MRKNITPTLFALCAVLFGIVALRGTIASAVQAWNENKILTKYPTAEGAYEYATLHFDARDAASYDTDRAEELFRRALALEPHLPYVRHQLARIEFLRGNFPAAILLLNEELKINPKPSPSTYYVRGLVLGYMGKYALAALDYKKYLESDPMNWAAINDYAWVLLKNGRSMEALVAIEPVLETWPDNPWLLNSAAIAAYEIGEEARARLHRARVGSRTNAFKRRVALRISGK